MVARRGQSAVGFVYGAYPAVALHPSVTHCRTVVRRAVIDEDHLPVLERLPDDRLHAAVKIVLDLVDRDYYGEQDWFHFLVF